MSLRLVDLSPELILHIVDLLLEEEKSSGANDDEDERFAELKFDFELANDYEKSRGDGENDETSNDDIIDDVSGKQSAEDQEPHRENLGQASKVTPSGEQVISNLSRACTYFYKLLSPYLFRSITLRNTEKSGAAVKYLCSTNQIAYVKTLHFRGTVPAEWSEDIRAVAQFFPPALSTVLSNLSQFPILETLIVDFDFRLEERHWYDHRDDVLASIIGDEDEETEDEIQKAEAQEGKRALVKKTFDAISMGAPDSIRELIFKDCPIRADSVFGSERFNKWLKKLESFKFQTYGVHNAEGRTLNTAPRFQRYINNMDLYFFNALENVTRLAIIGHKEAAFGQTMDEEVLIPLRAEHAPKLRELELGCYVIQIDLLDFLSSHSSTLEHLVFDHCLFLLEYFETSADDSDEPAHLPDWTWNRWFHYYASTKPRALQRVTFKPYNATIVPDCTSSVRKDIDEIPAARIFFDERKAEGREHRVFPYGIIDKNHGGIWESGRCNRYKALKGNDLEGWHKLMEVMKSNRERLRV